MNQIEGVCREVVEKAEWVAIATVGPEGAPHVVATWGDYMRHFGINGSVLLVPVGGMNRTEANLQRDPRVELLCGTRQVQGTHSPGKGCSIIGRAEMAKSGPEFDAVKAKFAWARAVLKVQIEKVSPQL